MIEIEQEETVDLSNVKMNSDEDSSKYQDKEDFRRQLEQDFSFICPKIEDFSYIGEGHFGYVYKAIRDNSDIAVKVMKPSWMNVDPKRDWYEEDIKEAKKSFILEYGMHEILSNLVDGIVKIYDGPEHRGHWYMVTELMSLDITMKSIVKRYRDFLLKDRVNMMIKITDIVEDIHDIQFHKDNPDKGFVHRDLKPENILFTRDTDVKEEKEGDKVTYFLKDGWGLKLTDFGLIRRIKQSSEKDNGHIVGTPYFMAPEQVLKPKEVDKRTDIYSLGATFYAMCNPGYHRDAQERINPGRLSQIMKKEPKDFYEQNDKIKGLQKIVMKCLRNDPDKRYQSATQLKCVLKDYVEEI